jgi:thioester reductase-like protein
MTPRHVLVTGATGFIGAALVAELLEHTDCQVTCLVRPRPGVETTDRLRTHLAGTLVDNDHAHLGSAVDERVTAVEGDLTDPDLAALARRLGDIDSVWHSAASLKYRNEDEDEIRLHNVTGTRRVLELTEASSATSFNYVSTAYVAGRRSGLIPEAEVPKDTEPNNHYERSKIDAEALVIASPVRSRVFRPSIVIGHSRTRLAASDAGVYGFLRDMRRFISNADDPSTLPPLNIAAHADTGLNLIPVDAVASAAVAVSLSDSTDEFFHLTNGHVAPVREAIPMVCELFGLAEPNFTDDLEGLSAEDRLLNRYLDFYLPYLGGERVFDRSNTDAIVGDRCDHALGPVEQREVVQTWIDSTIDLADRISA